MFFILGKWQAKTDMEMSHRNKTRTDVFLFDSNSVESLEKIEKIWKDYFMWLNKSSSKLSSHKSLTHFMHFQNRPATLSDYVYKRKF